MSRKYFLRVSRPKCRRAQERKIAIKMVDTESVVAWKEGRFEFNGNIKEIMRQISRWYDLHVDYEGNVGKKHLPGLFPVKNNVSEVLKMLELTGGIQFRIEDRKITVRSVDMIEINELNPNPSNEICKYILRTNFPDKSKKPDALRPHPA